MADLITRPEQRQWESLLIDVTRGSSGAYIGSATRTPGWRATHTADDLPTVDGVASGLMVPDGMYPQLLGVYVEEAGEALEYLLGSLGATGALSWWDKARGRIYTAEAILRVCLPRDDERLPAGLAALDVQWLIERPDSIEEVSS